MNTAASRSEPVAEFFSRNRGTIFSFLSFLVLPLLVWRMIWHFDAMVFIPFAVLGFCWFMILTTAVPPGDGVSPIFMRFVWRASAISLLSFFVVVGGPAGDIVVARSDATSLRVPIMFTAPFLGNLAFVPQEFGQTLYGVKVTAQDSIPLSCSVSAYGIRLDKRDQSALEIILTGMFASGDPAAAITKSLQEAIRTESAKVLGQLTAAQIADPLRKFTIPYAIGTPLGAALAANGLHWEGGNVSYSCRLDLNS